MAGQGAGPIPDCVWLSVISQRVPDDRAALCEAAIRLIEGLPAGKAYIAWLAKKMSRRVFKPGILGDAMSDPLSNTLIVSEERDRWHIDLQFSVRYPDAGYQRRWQTVIGVAASVPAMLAFAAAVQEQMGLVSASLAGHMDYWCAKREGTLISVEGRVDPLTDRRVYEDAMLSHRAQTRLRRLYPITIIGPELWAQLPPMPRFDPMPTVEDFGDAKLLRAWPTLCEPRAPAFLRANRELRAWLWPYTIQNPADHVDQDPT